jgi:hypoxanthine phosphoribosyltransferase
MADLLEQYPEMGEDIAEILLTPQNIHERVASLGREISRDYEGQNPLFVGVLKGMLFFMADLLRAVSIPVEVDFIAISGYGGKKRRHGSVRLIKDLEIPIEGRHVIFVEDVIDTGLTLNYILGSLRARSPASLEVCVIFNKPERRLIDLPIRYKGFDLPDRFVVGYGLDHREKYRNLPFVGLLKTDVLQNSKSG